MEHMSSLIINQPQTALVGITILLGETTIPIRVARVIQVRISHIHLRTGLIARHHIDHIVLQHSSLTSSNINKNF